MEKLGSKSKYGLTVPKKNERRVTILEGLHDMHADVGIELSLDDLTEDAVVAICDVQQPADGLRSLACELLISLLRRKGTKVMTDVLLEVLGARPGISPKILDQKNFVALVIAARSKLEEGRPFSPRVIVGRPHGGGNVTPSEIAVVVDPTKFMGDTSARLHGMYNRKVCKGGAESTEVQSAVSKRRPK